MKVLAIAPYEGLKELVTQLAKKEKLDIITEIGDLDKGLTLARAAKNEGIDIIISRGGTAELIQRELNIPVIEIEVSGYDMLRVLTLVKKYPGKTAIVGFAQIAEGAAAVCEILNISMSSFKVNQEKDIKAILESLKLNGYQNIIGDVITVKKAESLGLNGILLTSGKESVIRAFRNAEKAYELYKKIKNNYSLPHQILEAEHIGITIYDDAKNCIYSNKYFIHHVTEALELHLDNLVPKIKKNKKSLSIVKEEEYDWKINGEEISIGDSKNLLFKLEKIEKLNKNKDNGAFSSIGVTNRNNINTFISKNEKTQKIFNYVKQYPDKDSMIWINGERGTGKEHLAYYIHVNRNNINKAPFITFDCEAMEKSMWNEWLLRLLSKENNNKDDQIGTIFIKNIEFLSMDIQKELYVYLEECQKDFQLIVSCNTNIYNQILSGDFYESLYNLLSETSFALPPLRERKEDIEGLASIFINEMNLKYGKQIVGLRKDVKEYLENRAWTGNINQLKQMINSSVLLADGYYLELGDIVEIEQEDSISDAGNSFPLFGTLEEIEKRIIQQVWLEEGKNQTRTAERLGINRTTLWRKLK
ncbi:PrpR N-terminal domain-containing protein [Niallia nealsonii]|nr:sigma-54-dependent transcriptional regulator [Niallia nealsonii]